MAIKRPIEVATIDATLVVLTNEADETDSIGITSNTEVATEVQVETTDANKLMIKGTLKAQKLEKKTITGVKVTLTDNLTLLEAAKACQGGTITYAADGSIQKYTPPVVDGEEKPVKYTCDVYSSCMDAGGDTIKYEKISYPHCVGEPVAYNAKDDEWRTAQYVLNSTAKNGEAPYSIEYVSELPEVVEPGEPVTPPES